MVMNMNKIEDLNGVGPRTRELFHKLGIDTIEDLLYYYPKRYQVIKKSDMRNIKNGDKVIIDGIIDGQPTMMSLNKNLKKTMFRISNDRMVINISIYNQIYLYKELKPGMKVTVIGKYEYDRICDVQKLVTRVALGTEIPINNIQDRYFIFPKIGYVRQE